MSPPDPKERRRRFIVRTLKIVLPLFAVGVFASFFIFSGGYDDRISFDGVDLASLDEGLKIANPKFEGVTAKGEPFTVTAVSALPDGPDPDEVKLDTVKGEIDTADGRKVTVGASAGVLYPKAKTVDLTDGVHLKTSDGYSLTAQTGSFDSRAGELTANGAVTVVGPMGRITAEHMRAIRKKGDAQQDGESAYIWFKNRVTVRIDRPNRGAKAPD